MLRIELKDDEVTAGLARLGAAMSNLAPVMEDIGEVLVENAKARFAAGVDPAGNAWAPKSAVTIEAYRRRGDSVSFRPLIGPSRALSTTVHAVAGSSSVEIGSTRIQAAVMQQGAAQGAFGRTRRGGPIPWGRIPARPFIGLSEQDRTAILDIVADWLEGVAAGS